MIRLLLLLSLTMTAPALAENIITAAGAGFSFPLGIGADEPTIHRAEFGDGPTDLAPQRRPSATRAESQSSPPFHGTTFVYGEGLLYRPGTRQESGDFDYNPDTRFARRVYQPEAGEWMRRRYDGVGERSDRRRTYRPEIRYGENVRLVRHRRYRFGQQ